jgi:hypothetical protein
MFVQLLKEGKSEILWDELLEYIRGQGKVIDPEDVHHSSDTINDDKAAEIVIETVDDIISSASKQSLSKVLFFLQM